MGESGLFRFFFRHCGDGCLVELDHGAFRDFKNDRGVLDIVNDAVDAGGSDDLVSLLQCGQTCGVFFTLLLLGADHQEVENRDEGDRHDGPVSEKICWAAFGLGERKSREESGNGDHDADCV